MFNPTIELHEYNDEGKINILLRKEVKLDQNAFPEVIIWKDETFIIEDYEPMIHATYVKAHHLKITYAPVTT